MISVVIETRSKRRNSMVAERDEIITDSEYMFEQLYCPLSNSFFY